MSDESSLIDRSLQGDSAAFGDLVRLHQDRLFNAIVHLAGDRAEAEDIVQEAFLQAYLKLDSFQRHIAFYTWLYRIAFNNSVSRRRKKRVESSADRNRDVAGEEPTAGGTLRGIRWNARNRPARSSKHSRSSATSTVRSSSCGKSTAATTRPMPGADINIGTVRSRLHRARLQLRDKFHQLCGW